MNPAELAKHEPLIEDTIAQLAGVHRSTIRRIIGELELACVYHLAVYRPSDAAAILRQINAEQLHRQRNPHETHSNPRPAKPQDKPTDFGKAMRSAGR